MDNNKLRVYISLEFDIRRKDKVSGVKIIDTKSWNSSYKNNVKKRPISTKIFHSTYI